jgi:glutamate racemase
VPLIENGRTSPDDPALGVILSEYMQPLLAADVDTIILGCTHFPHIAGAVASLAPGVTLVDAGRETAARCAASLPLKRSGRAGSIRCFVSDTPDNFTVIAERFLGQPLANPAVRVEIEEY